MLKSVMHDIRLAVQAKNGLTPAVLCCMAFVALAALGAFAFLCVAGYDWLAPQFGASRRRIDHDRRAHGNRGIRRDRVCLDAPPRPGTC